jgi:hypothetical protein
MRTVWYKRLPYILGAIVFFVTLIMMESGCARTTPILTETQLQARHNNYIPLPDSEWVEVFVEAPEDNTYKAECFGPEKIIKYYISPYSPELYWVRLHERGHAWQWTLYGDMWHCDGKCVMAERGTVSQIEVYGASISRGGHWFCDECRKRLKLK